MARRDPVWLAIMKLGFWVGGVLLFFRFLMHLVAFLGGDVRDFWVLVAGASTVFLTLYGDFLKRIRFPDGEGSESSALPIMLAEAGDKNAIVTIANGANMSDEPNTGNRILHINNAPSYHNNTPGGIIGSGPITIHQHFDKPQSPPSAPDVQIRDAVVTDPDAETASLAELLDYAETLLGKALSENTIRNELERRAVESCGEEKRGRARAKLYPKTQAKQVISDYVFTNKKK